MYLTVSLSPVHRIHSYSFPYTVDSKLFEPSIKIAMTRLKLWDSSVKVSRSPHSNPRATSQKKKIKKYTKKRIIRTISPHFLMLDSFMISTVIIQGLYVVGSRGLCSCVQIILMLLFHDL